MAKGRNWFNGEFYPSQLPQLSAVQGTTSVRRRNNETMKCLVGLRTSVQDDEESVRLATDGSGET